MGRWKLTFRHGSRVERERLESLDDALAALRSRIDDVASEPPRKAVQVLQPAVRAGGAGDGKG